MKMAVTRIKWQNQGKILLQVCLHQACPALGGHSFLWLLLGVCAPRPILGEVRSTINNPQLPIRFSGKAGMTQWRF